MRSAIQNGLGYVACVLMGASSGLARTQVGWQSGFDWPGVPGVCRSGVSVDEGGGSKLYVTGSFRTAAGAHSPNLVRWDGSAWSGPPTPWPTPTNSSAETFDALVADDGSGPKLYVGGISVRRRNGALWETLATAVGGGARDMTFGAVGSLQAQLYIAGVFTSIDSNTTLRGVARWNGVQWQSVAHSFGGFGNFGDVRRVEIVDLGQGPELYAAGSFSGIDGTSANHVARWNGTTWSPLGAGLTNTGSESARTLALYDDGVQRVLYVGGPFQGAGGITSPGLIAWDGAAWQAVAPPTWGSFADVTSLYVTDLGAGPELYLAGNFALNSGASMFGVARRTASGWSSPVEFLNPSAATGTYTSVERFAAFDAGAGPRVHAFGDFSRVGGVAARGVARFEGGAWQALGGPEWGLSRTVRSITTVDSGAGPELYVAGDFESAQDPAAKYVAKRVGQTWQPIGAPQSKCSSIASFSSGGVEQLHAAFENPSRVSRWDGSTWVSIGDTNANGAIAQIETIDYGGGRELYAVGAFTSIGGTNATNIAKWNGLQWAPLGSGMPSFTIAITRFDHGGNSYLYAAMGLTGAGVQPLRRWDGVSWASVPAALQNFSSVAAPHTDCLAVYGGQLYAGGTFEQIGNAAAQNIARFNGTSWSPVAGGLGDPNDSTFVFDLEVHDDGAGPKLFAGGLFPVANGASGANSVACWDGAAWSHMDGGLLQSSGAGRAHALKSANSPNGPKLYVGGMFAASGEFGASNIASWGADLEPSVYCTAKVNSAGCTPAISSSGIASATLGAGFTVAAANVLNQRNGLLFYGVNGANSAPFQGGILCVSAPLRRLPIASSGGSPSGVDCSGGYAYDFNARVASGVDPALIAGVRVHAQWYSRDPQSSFAVGLTNALAFEVRE